MEYVIYTWLIKYKVKTFWRDRILEAEYITSKDNKAQIISEMQSDLSCSHYGRKIEILSCEVIKKSIGHKQE